MLLKKKKKSSVPLCSQFVHSSVTPARATLSTPYPQSPQSPQVVTDSSVMVISHISPPPLSGSHGVCVGGMERGIYLTPAAAAVNRRQFPSQTSALESTRPFIFHIWSDATRIILYRSSLPRLNYLRRTKKELIITLQSTQRCLLCGIFLLSFVRHCCSRRGCGASETEKICLTRGRHTFLHLRNNCRFVVIKSWSVDDL